MMPLIGQAIQKGIRPNLLSAGGMLLFFIYSMWGYKIISPQTGEMDFFWMLMLRGFAMSMLFIPITTMSLSTLKGQEIGQGASFTGMTRQLGGSFGIALITTFMSRQNATHRSDLLSHLSIDNNLFQTKLHGIQAQLMSKGMAPNEAMAAAYKVMDLSVSGQSAVLTYMDVFLYIGVMFLMCVPFLLMIRSSKRSINLAESMH